MSNPTQYDGGPAFPVMERQEHADGAIVCHQFSGLSVRDWFAGMALQGLISSKTFHSISDPSGSGHKIHGLAMASYSIADAMLKERDL